MNTPRFFSRRHPLDELASVLGGLARIWRVAAKQPTIRPPRQTIRITFVGTVSQVAATTLAAVPKSPQTLSFASTPF